VNKAIAAAALLLLVACSGPVSTSASGPAVKQMSSPMPDLRGPTLQGGTVVRGDYAGKVMVVNFWATWCGPCRREQPALQQLSTEFANRDVYFLGVNYRDDPAAARAYLKQFGVTYPSIEDRAGALAGDFGFLGLPDTYVVDRTGQIRYWGFGAMDEAGLRSLLTKVLAERG
jgi:cytochrome c biogenesis protein CcmG, thiol:disulfide interchange protein DsbE